MSKKFDLKEFKDSIKVTEAEYKKDTWIELDDCLKDVLKMKGFPLGHLIQCYGKSDSGKTSLMLHAATQAQKQGILPILLVTENKLEWARAEAMGFDKSTAIVEENLKYLENVFDFIDNKIITNVMNGKLPYNVMVFWDSMGNTISEKSIKINEKTGEREIKNIHMQAAAIKSERLSILMDRVNDTRKINYPYAVGVFIINHVYSGVPAYSGAPTPEIVKGGNKVKFTASLMIKTQLLSKLEAIKDSQKLKFGICSRLSVTKNHINGQEFSGEFIITKDKFMANDAKLIKQYKEDHKDLWGDLELYENEEES